MAKQNGKPKAGSKRVPWTKKDGEGLKRMRRTFGISQGQLGTAVGVTSSRICECERVNFPNGRHCSPGRELGDKIASHFAKLATQRKAAVARKKAKSAKKTPKPATVEAIPVEKPVDEAMAEAKAEAVA